MAAQVLSDGWYWILVAPPPPEDPLVDRLSKGLITVGVPLLAVVLCCPDGFVTSHQSPCEISGMGQCPGRNAVVIRCLQAPSCASAAQSCSRRIPALRCRPATPLASKYPATVLSGAATIQGPHGTEVPQQLLMSLMDSAQIS